MAVKNKIRILFLGTDKGGVLFEAVVLLFVFSLLFLSLVPRIAAMKETAAVYRKQVFSRIQQENEEILRNHDLH